MRSNNWTVGFEDRLEVAHDGKTGEVRNLERRFCLGPPEVSEFHVKGMTLVYAVVHFVARLFGSVLLAELNEGFTGEVSRGSVYT